MAKQKQIESVLHDWVHTLTFQQQALLLTGVRGPDGRPTHCTAKFIVRFLRGAIAKPAGNWNGSNNNSFMWGDYTDFDSYVSVFADQHDELPHHFIMHLVHCGAVIGYKHPDWQIAAHWKFFYISMCKAFHMAPETEAEIDNRLNDFGCGVHNNAVPCENNEPAWCNQAAVLINPKNKTDDNNQY